MPGCEGGRLSRQANHWHLTRTCLDGASDVTIAAADTRGTGTGPCTAPSGPRRGPLSCRAPSDRGLTISDRGLMADAAATAAPRDPYDSGLFLSAEELGELRRDRAREAPKLR